MHYVYSNEALPQPISKKKDKKKKLKAVTTLNVAEAEADWKTVNTLPEVASYNVAPVNTVLDKKPGWLRERVHANCPQFFFRRTETNAICLEFYLECPGKLHDFRMN